MKQEAPPINLLDRMIMAVAPKSGFERIRTRAAMASLYGNAYTGASRTKRSLKGWFSSSGDSDSEVLPAQPTLRARSRDLFRNNAIATGAIRKMVTNVVGPGLRLEASIDADFLNLSAEEAEAWEDNVEREFRLWSESTDCDASRKMDFYEIQELAFLSQLNSGEILGLLPIVPRKGSVYDLRIQLIESDRLCNPDDRQDDEKIAGGIELGKYGEPIAYHIQTNATTFLSQRREWKRVAAFGSNSGRPNVLHLFRSDRPGQRRGLPYLTPIIETLKQLGRYQEAELQAAVISAFFTVFVKNVPPGGLDENFDAGVIVRGPDGQPEVDTSPRNYELGPGAMVYLDKDEGIETANPGRPNAQFDPFMLALFRQIGMGLEIPYEVIIQHFQSSYTAARGAILEFLKVVKARRFWLGRKWCQPIYLEWLSEAIAKGRIRAPGFFDDPAIARAWAGAEWIGPTQGLLDPLKETKADQLSVAEGFETRAEVVSRRGGDFNKKIRKRKREEELMRDAGLGQQQVLPFNQQRGGTQA